ncbi:type II toxin-antitoxin system HicB family antitoxin [Burkholderia ubonensis]|uniref:type II toxin-antitoxin system HicB family antitoxin n=1 Tax=Burkholderia ubonensis TaxID=101571 RepID=UPI00075EA0CE|nr:type II toxin-antitoxin system HicB family antitoxin [Burkholderia ubonensis]KWN69694.1 antitoxin [Burkholderia ubonensis]
MLRYPAWFEPDDDGGFVITFRDIPEAISQSNTRDEARAMGADALLTALDFYFEDKRPVPAPTKAKSGEELIALAVSVSAKVMLLNQMLAQGVTPVELARRLQMSRHGVNRLVDPACAANIDAIARAMAVLGKRLEISID